MSSRTRPSAVTGRLDVWVVEDGTHLRQTIHEYIDRQDGMACSLSVESCEEAIEELERGRVPSVILLDLGLPGMGGLEGIGRIRSITPETQIVVLTVREDDESVFEALCAGACGYLLKPATGERIVEAIETASAGGAPMNAFIARKVLAMFNRYVRPSADYGLTDREREILGLLSEEMTQKEIAEQLFVSPHTVDTHLRNIYSKLHVQSRTGAVAKALRERLI